MTISGVLSQQLADLSEELGLLPAAKRELLARIPEGALTIGDVPEDIRWLYQRVMGDIESPVTASLTPVHLFTCLNPLHYGPCRHAHPHLLRHVEAMAMQDRMLSGKPWTEPQQEGLEKYADGAAWQMNDLLRGKPNDLIDDRTHAWVKGAAQGMRPLPRAVSAFRGVGLEAFGVSSVNDLRALQGRTVQEPGFLSTTIDPDQAFPGKVHLELDVPAGTPAAYLEGLNPAGEFELLLGPGRRIMIGNVEVNGDTAVVKATVVG